MKSSPGTKAICTAFVALAVSTFCASAQVLTFEEAKQRADQGDAFEQDQDLPYLIKNNPSSP